MASNKSQEQIISSMTRAEQDAQTIRQRDEQIKRLTAEVRAALRVIDVLVAVGKLKQGHVEEARAIVTALSDE